MSRLLSGSRKYFALSLLATAVSALPVWAAAGHVLTGGGPVHVAMAGASTGGAVDGASALYWNPATMASLPSSSLDFGLELLYPETSVASSIPAGGFGRLGPATPLAGSERGDNGFFPIPSVALVYKPEDSAWSYGLGVFTIGGFGTNFAASTTNPILTAQPPNGFGLGAVYSELLILQVAPSVAVQLTDRLAFSAGPTIDIATLKADPLFVASPDNAANPLFASYPQGTHTRFTWGGGVQAGMTFALDGGLQLGVSVKSPQWFEDFRFLTTDQRGRPRTVVFNVDHPMVASFGVAYSGIERLFLAADFRYIDYQNTNGFRQSGFDRTGAVRGLGWDSIFSLSLGARYWWTDWLSVQGGYSYNQNPIADSLATFNVASSTVIEHSLYLGASYKVTDNFSLSLAYAHGFDHSITGPYVTPLGTIPNSSIRNTTGADSILFGGSVTFGGRTVKNY